MVAIPTVRFAPSPTGLIHIGNARTALINWLYASRAAGRFILRFDDTDLERSRREYADSIEADLAWLGIVPDITCRQSERMALYDAAAESLHTAIFAVEECRQEEFKEVCEGDIVDYGDDYRVVFFPGNLDDVVEGAALLIEAGFTRIG